MTEESDCEHKTTLGDYLRELEAQHLRDLDIELVFEGDKTNNLTLLALLSEQTLWDTDLSNIYALPILGRFAPHSPAMLADEQPDGFLYFLDVERATVLHEQFVLEGDPDAEITDEEWSAAAKKVIDHVNGWHDRRQALHHSIMTMIQKGIPDE